MGRVGSEGLAGQAMHMPSALLLYVVMGWLASGIPWASRS